MQKLSKKDKKMMIILVLFLFGVAYYEFLIEPLTKMDVSSQQALIKKRKELLVAQTKLGGLTNYKKKIMGLKNIIYIAEGNNKMPDLSEKLNDKMEAVMQAAKDASVNVLSLKPINAITENDDGTVNTVKDKYISIDGNASIDSFLKFMRNLWGVALEELELSSASKDGSKLRFYIKLSFLPKSSFNIDTAVKGNTVDTDIKFELKHNIFTKIIPPPPPPPPKPPGPPPPPPKPVHYLNNANLLGIADIGAEKMAVIQDGQKNVTDFITIGSKFRDSKLWKVDNNSAVFLFSDGGTVTLKLPEEKKYYTVDDGGNMNDRQKGHLGILAETFTEQLAQQYDIPFRPGLLVISSGAHGDKLKKGDIITSINGQETPNFEAALGVMQNVYAGEKLEISLFRQDESLNISYRAD